ncbi:hypothetical protein H0H92_006811 [Tricholoma furcatifolium]|nr:hypothetical protein H0H92_006811 [Tricholoma furcatifolium]
MRGGANTARMAALHAGIPDMTSLNTVNYQCSHRFTSVNQITNQIKAGKISIGIGQGRPQSITPKLLSKLKLAFSKTGSTHARNANQVSNSAVTVSLARRDVAEKLRLFIHGKFVLAQTVSVAPKVMGIGPAYAIPKVLEKTGLSLSDVDFWEINEAFASQALYSIRKLGILVEKVNVHGGAIALGHPLGCTGTRQIATGLNIAQQYDARIFITSMCIGSSMGMMAVFVSEH